MEIISSRNHVFLTRASDLQGLGSFQAQLPQGQGVIAAHTAWVPAPPVRAVLLDLRKIRVVTAAKGRVTI